MKIIQKLKKYYKIFKDELFKNVLPFWVKFSLDKEYGGYFTCLTEDGKVYDTKKYMWLQARQVFIFSRLYNTVNKNQEWLEIAKLGVDFIRKYGRTPEGRVYFCLTREGKPYWIQRKVFSECFYVLALSEYSKASGDRECFFEAIELLKKIVVWRKDLTLVGRPKFNGMPIMSTLAIPMILLNVIDEIKNAHGDIGYNDLQKELVKEISLHVKDDLRAVFENVGIDGSVFDSPEGRLLNPGHSIEAAWFLLHYYLHKNPDEQIKNMALNMIDYSMERGWDKKYGGIFYFVDYKNLPPIQLEWSMKLWWPHTEALYALLLAYVMTKKKKYFNLFEKVYEWTFSHFPDRKHGEWYGYLDRRGQKTHTLKGGPYKGCYHVPRFLLYSIQYALPQMVD
jgi:N-acylglucosamine 2-epimerase